MPVARISSMQHRPQRILRMSAVKSGDKPESACRNILGQNGISRSQISGDGQDRRSNREHRSPKRVITFLRRPPGIPLKRHGQLLQHRLTFRRSEIAKYGVQTGCQCLHRDACHLLFVSCKRAKCPKDAFDGGRDADSDGKFRNRLPAPERFAESALPLGIGEWGRLKRLISFVICPIYKRLRPAQLGAGLGKARACLFGSLIRFFKRRLARNRLPFPRVH